MNVWFRTVYRLDVVGPGALSDLTLCFSPFGCLQNVVVSTKVLVVNTGGGVTVVLGNKGTGVVLLPAEDGPEVSSGMGGMLRDPVESGMEGVLWGPVDNGMERMLWDPVESGIGGIVRDLVDTGHVGQRVLTMVEVVVPMSREVELPLI